MILEPIRQELPGDPYFAITRNGHGKYAVIGGQNIERPATDRTLMTPDEKLALRVSVQNDNYARYVPWTLINDYVNCANNLNPDGSLRGRINAALKIGELEFLIKTVANQGVPFIIEKPRRITPPPGRGV